ncbi:hypothetical protein [Cupriavidus basilensis]
MQGSYLLSSSSQSGLFGAEVFSFTMLTINSDKPPQMNRFHARARKSG